MNISIAEKMWTDHGEPFLHRGELLTIRAKIIAQGHIAWGFKWKFGHTERLFDCPQKSDMNNFYVAKVAAKAWCDGFLFAKEQQ